LHTTTFTQVYEFDSNLIFNQPLLHNHIVVLLSIFARVLHY